MENKSPMESHEDHKEWRQETEMDVIEKSEGVNLLTHETNCVLKRPKKDDKERRRLMEFKGNFENAKRKQSLYYGQSKMSFSSSLPFVNLLFSFKELKSFVFLERRLFAYDPLKCKRINEASRTLSWTVGQPTAIGRYRVLQEFLGRGLLRMVGPTYSQR
ncbi:hypothetical protein M9H77_06800 [Catharanthus roseus]|uniref:Uncharacterized protein n=1 Tax=Catharanthus roseus TaxID=4058 RepID=A0ACC0BT52_CATRO|nr:hypothetical protein M9H77_06800 [Catharanthus roseus]